MPVCPLSRYVILQTTDRRGDRKDIYIYRLSKCERLTLAKFNVPWVSQASQAFPSPWKFPPPAVVAFPISASPPPLGLCLERPMKGGGREKPGSSAGIFGFANWGDWKLFAPRQIQLAKHRHHSRLASSLWEHKFCTCISDLSAIFLQLWSVCRKLLCMWYITLSCISVCTSDLKANIACQIFFHFALSLCVQKQPAFSSFRHRKLQAGPVLE